jgi:hypothetical protein
MYLYHIRFSSSKETFEKIGITSRSVQERFSSEFYRGFDLKILYLINSNKQEILSLEKEYLSKYESISYKPINETFSGKTECFEPYFINLNIDQNLS